jgi:plasmid stabilization system protein ParE
MVFNIAPAAQQEVSDAAKWYDQQRPGYGQEFMTAFRRACQTIRENPLGGAILETQDDPHIRRVILHKFPYAVIYDCQDAPAEVRIVAVSHMSRQPNYWTGR